MLVADWGLVQPSAGSIIKRQSVGRARVARPSRCVVSIGRLGYTLGAFFVVVRVLVVHFQLWVQNAYEAGFPATGNARTGPEVNATREPSHFTSARWLRAVKKLP